MKWVFSLLVLGVLVSGLGVALPGALVPDATVEARNRDRDDRNRDRGRNHKRVLVQFVHDLNRGDVDAAMSHFAPDAVKVGGSLCAPVICTTPDQIRAEWEFDVATNIHVDILEYRRFSNIEVARARLTSDDLPGPAIVMVAVAKRGDQFVSFSALRDTSNS